MIKKEIFLIKVYKFNKHAKLVFHVYYVYHKNKIVYFSRHAIK